MSTKQGAQASWLNIRSNQEAEKRKAYAGSPGLTAKKEVEVGAGRMRLIAYWAPRFRLGRWKSLGNMVMVQQWWERHHRHWIVHLQMVNTPSFTLWMVRSSSSRKKEGRGGPVVCVAGRGHPGQWLDAPARILMTCGFLSPDLVSSASFLQVWFWHLLSNKVSDTLVKTHVVSQSGPQGGPRLALEILLGGVICIQS